jgi:excisionase family DNA binding protein
MLLTIGKTAKEVGVSIDTLRRWEREGKIVSQRTAGGHRRYDLEVVKRYIAGKSETTEKVTVIYARVSTASRKNDLAMQVQKMELYCAAHGWKYRSIEDIGSGLNYNKKGLQELIKLIETNQVDRLVLNYKDRLLRFGSEIIFEMCRYHNVEVIVLNEDEHKTSEEELVEDVLSIITVFSAKLYGSRSHKNKKVVEEAKQLFKVVTEEK